ncbi:MAG TPA: glycerol-3-phosphate 1-O-acyltransferase PlsY [Candidatus Elarobacter sp.]|nr:glycerol-3-phosphate 1-O-acyltransferase PlsY [Candidatus Elarobacter sp.]
MSVALTCARVAIFAFGIGAIPFGVLISRAFYNTDIRKSGSGNIGAANALRTLGKRGAIAVLVLDALKGLLPTLAIGLLFGPVLGPLPAACAAIASVAGHCWSPFLGFKGGKGVATFLGAAVALWWPAGLAFAIVWGAVVLACGYASVGSMLASLAMAPVLWFGIGRTGLAAGLICSLLIVVRHRENLGRLRRGTENRFTLLKAERQP